MIWASVSELTSEVIIIPSVKEDDLLGVGINLGSENAGHQSNNDQHGFAVVEVIGVSADPNPHPGFLALLIRDHGLPVGIDVCCVFWTPIHDVARHLPARSLAVAEHGERVLHLLRA